LTAIFNKNYFVRFNLDNHKPPLSQVTSERIQKTATIQTEETSAISSATENENSSVSNQRFFFK